MQQKNIHLISARELVLRFIIISKTTAFSRARFDGKTRKLLYYVVEESQVRSLFHFHFPFDVEQSKVNNTCVLYVRNIHSVKGLNT